jgi:adenylosuccinate synthase
VHYIVTGLGFGDEGKGTTVDYLARIVRDPYVVRHNGGCQAAHNVVLPNGKHHTFSQFGAGTLAGAKTHLSKYMVLNPLNLKAEACALIANFGFSPDELFDMVNVAESALVITPWHQHTNRLREISRGEGRHGSCGQGIGETVSDSLKFPEHAVRARDLRDRETLMAKAKWWRDYKMAEVELFDVPNDDLAVFTQEGVIERWVDLSMAVPLSFVGDDFVQDIKDRHVLIFEGAQGVLLDEWWGFHPHTTWSTTTCANAEELLGPNEPVKRIGVMRTYMTRHGAGPFMEETTRGYWNEKPEPHNGTGQFQGEFRTGPLDLPLLRYATQVQPVDGLFVTHMDRLVDDGSTFGSVAVAFAHVTHGSSPYERRPLNKCDQPDLSYQEQLTAQLNDCIPVYDHWPVRSFRDLLEEDLGVAVHGWSVGPTHEGKAMGFGEKRLVALEDMKNF